MIEKEQTSNSPTSCGFCQAAHLPGTLDHETESLILHATECAKKISRTFNGISDTSTSKIKQPLLLEGEELATQVESNFQDALRFLVPSFSQKIDSVSELEKVIEHAVHILNYRLVDPQLPILRQWETGIDAHPPLAELPSALEEFYQEMYQRLSMGSDPIERAAWCEQNWNLKLHPLYDGCGRSSKALAAALLAVNKLPYPAFSTRDEYFNLALRPEQQWLNEYRERVLKPPRTSS